jgi:hypothetical protein
MLRAFADELEADDAAGDLGLLTFVPAKGGGSTH